MFNSPFLCTHGLLFGNTLITVSSDPHAFHEMGSFLNMRCIDYLLMSILLLLLFIKIQYIFNATVGPNLTKPKLRRHRRQNCVLFE